MTNTGVPNSAASSVTGTPAIDTTPSSPRTVLRGHTFGASVQHLGRRLRPGRGAAVVDLLGVPRARRDGRSHALRCGDAEDRQAVRDDLAGGLAQRQPRGVQIVGLPRRPAAAPGRSRRTGGSRRRGPRGSGETRCGSRSAAAVFSTRGNSPMLRISVPSFSCVSSSRCAVSGTRPSSAALRASADSRACAYCT